MQDKKERHTPLTPEEEAIYEWQIWVEGFGKTGQEKLKSTTALVSRVGGLGGPLSFALAAAGFGKLILAHGGNTKHSDLNRQITQTHDWLGKPRVVSSKQRLQAMKPRMEIEAVNSNITEDNAEELVGQADIVFDCAPLFQERFLMNRECVRQNKPLIEAAMFDTQGQLTTIIPGQTPCLSCIYPEFPDQWKRQFPVFGAVSGAVANLAAMEGIKLLTGFGELLAGTMLFYDTRTMDFRKVKMKRRGDCPICGSSQPQ